MSHALPDPHAGCGGVGNGGCGDGGVGGLVIDGGGDIAAANRNTIVQLGVMDFSLATLDHLLEPTSVQQESHEMVVCEVSRVHCAVFSPKQ